jgi:hypothetical protein
MPKTITSAQPAHAAPVFATTAVQTAERELKVRILPSPLNFWEYEGSRAQLEGEGVIPVDIQWPEGTQSCEWESGRFRYWLRRTRPDGVKGPMKVWTSGDYWSLRCYLIGGPDVNASRILELRRALAEELYRQSPAGRAEWNAQWKRYCEAGRDEAFQAFKSTLLPERKKPGRKARGRVTPKVTPCSS